MPTSSTSTLAAAHWSCFVVEQRPCESVPTFIYEATITLALVSKHINLRFLQHLSIVVTTLDTYNTDSLWMFNYARLLIRSWALLLLISLKMHRSLKHHSLKHCSLPQGGMPLAFLSKRS